MIEEGFGLEERTGVGGKRGSGSGRREGDAMR